MSIARLYRKPAALHPHPLLERITTKWAVLTQLRKGNKPDHAEALEEVGQDWAAFVADIKAHGVIVPLKIALIKGTEYICDGRHRWQAATEAEVDVVPVELVTEGEALTIMESTMIGRQHMTKGQRAYAAVVLHPEVATEADQRKRANLKAGDSPIRTECGSGVGMEELATKFGVSVRLIEQACQLYRDLDASKTLRAKHEWRVFAGFGLGAIIAGIAGDQATTALPRASTPQGIVKPIASLRTFWEAYHKQSAEQRDIALEHGQKALSEGAPEFLDFLNELVRGAIEIKSEKSNDDEEDGE